MNSLTDNKICLFWYKWYWNTFISSQKLHSISEQWFVSHLFSLPLKAIGFSSCVTVAIKKCLNIHNDLGIFRINWIKYMKNLSQNKKKRRKRRKKKRKRRKKNLKRKRKMKKTRKKKLKKKKRTSELCCIFTVIILYPWTVIIFIFHVIF